MYYYYKAFMLHIYNLILSLSHGKIFDLKPVFIAVR